VAIPAQASTDSDSYGGLDGILLVMQPTIRGLDTPAPRTLNAAPLVVLKSGDDAGGSGRCWNPVGSRA
jgi:hypothetical protein